MNIVIAGVGKYGKELTKELANENHNIIIIDNKVGLVEDIVNQFDVMGYFGNAASYDVQVEAGVNNADLFIATTGSDETNILCCLVAKKLGARMTIARLRNPEYAKQAQIMQNELGISFTVNPYLDTASEIFRILRFPAANKVETFANGRVNLVETRIDAASELADKTLADIKNKLQLPILVCAVVRDNEAIIPKGDFMLKEKDTIYIAADTNVISNAFKKLKISKSTTKSVMIIGGGRITYYLADMLIHSGVSVKIFEKDRPTCQMLSEEYPQATIIHADGTSNKSLLEEGIDKVDSLVTLTGMDETNIIVSSYAKSIGCKKVITKINKSSYDAIINTIGLDTVVSPKGIFANMIIKYARGMESTLYTEFKTLYRLVGNKVEALEFSISKETSYTGIPIKNLKFKKNFLLASIIRANKVIIPSGNDTLEALDSVVIVTTETTVKDLSDILE